MTLRQSLQARAGARCRRRHCEEAITALEEILSRWPDEAETHYQVGVCYSGACQRHAWTHPDVARGHFLHALRLLGRQGNPELRARILGSLGYVFVQSAELSKLARLRTAIQCEEQAAELFWRLGQLDAWAREQYNLGNLWCEFPEGASSDKWHRAVEHFENALVIRTRDRDPDRYAATLQNLGTAYRELPTRDKGAYVRRTIDCYRKALRIYTAVAFPLKNAALHNNLGNAHLSLPEVDREDACRNARRALRHFERALRVWTRREHRCDYAIARFNSGTAMMRLSLGDSRRDKCQEQAAACFRDAAECFVLCGQPGLAAAARVRREQIQEFQGRSPLP